MIEATANPPKDEGRSVNTPQKDTSKSKRKSKSRKTRIVVVEDRTSPDRQLLNTSTGSTSNTAAMTLSFDQSEASAFTAATLQTANTPLNRSGSSDQPPMDISGNKTESEAGASSIISAPLSAAMQSIEKFAADYLYRTEEKDAERAGRTAAGKNVNVGKEGLNAMASTATNQTLGLGVSGANNRSLAQSDSIYTDATGYTSVSGNHPVAHNCTPQGINPCGVAANEQNLDDRLSPNDSMYSYESQSTGRHSPAPYEPALEVVMSPRSRLAQAPEAPEASEADAEEDTFASPMARMRHAVAKTVKAISPGRQRMPQLMQRKTPVSQPAAAASAADDVDDKDMSDVNAKVIRPRTKSTPQQRRDDYISDKHRKWKAHLNREKEEEARSLAASTSDSKRSVSRRRSRNSPQRRSNSNRDRRSRNDEGNVLARVPNTVVDCIAPEQHGRRPSPVSMLQQLVVANFNCATEGAVSESDSSDSDYESHYSDGSYSSDEGSYGSSVRDTRKGRRGRSRPRRAKSGDEMKYTNSEARKKQEERQRKKKEERKKREERAKKKREAEEKKKKKEKKTKKTASQEVTEEPAEDSDTQNNLATIAPFATADGESQKSSGGISWVSAPGDERIVDALTNNDESAEDQLPGKEPPEEGKALPRNGAPEEVAPAPAMAPPPRSVLKSKPPIKNDSEEEKNAVADINDKNFVKAFIEEFANNGISLLMHTLHDAQSYTQPHHVDAYLKLGAPADGIFTEPSIVWDIASSDSRGRQNVRRRTVGLFDVVSIEKANVMSLHAYPFAIPGKSFFVVMNDGEAILFEAKNDTEQTRIIQGIRWIVARLAFNLIIGNRDVGIEMLSYAGVNATEDDPIISKAMTDVTNQLVDKSVERAKTHNIRRPVS